MSILQQFKSQISKLQQKKTRQTYFLNYLRMVINSGIAIQQRKLSLNHFISWKTLVLKQIQTPLETKTTLKMKRTTIDFQNTICRIYSQLLKSFDQKQAYLIFTQWLIKRIISQINDINAKPQKISQEDIFFSNHYLNHLQTKKFITTQSLNHFNQKLFIKTLHPVMVQRLYILQNEPNQ